LRYGLSSSDDSKWLSSLEDSDWLSQVSELLQTATQISVAMECDKSSVLISYEDGIDRTAQVCCYRIMGKKESFFKSIRIKQSAAVNVSHVNQKSCLCAALRE